MPTPSIYRSPEGEAEILALYDDMLSSLNLQSEEHMVDTHFGDTHVLVSGPEDASPLVILHVLNVNVEAEMPRPATKNEMKKLQAPVLVIAAEKDVMFPAKKVMSRARQCFPNMKEAVCLDGSSHFPSREDIDKINHRIKQFLSDT